MKGEGIVFLLLFAVFMISFVSSDSPDTSTAETEVNVLGCKLDDESFFAVGSCSGGRWYYCHDNNDKWDVLKVPNACSKSKPTPGDEVCCPSGYYCKKFADGVKDGGEGYYCALATTDCTSIKDPDECRDHVGQCFWDDKCYDRVYNCYDYNEMDDSENLCENDPQGVARGDVNCRHGEVMSGGIPYIIEEGSCNCFWGDVDGDGNYECGLNYSIVNSFVGSSTDVPTCKYTLLESGDCTEGYESYTYEATLNDGGDLEEGDARCFDREGRRRCGESVVKVPFFSLLNVVVFGFLMGLFYFFRVLNKTGGRVE